MPSLLDMDSFMQGQNAQPTGLGTIPSYNGEDINNLIDEISLTEGVDPELIRAVVKLESGFNPNAKASTSSASGLMQLVKGTAAEMGVQDVFDPRQNLTGGIRYLKKHLDATGGDVDKALRMYNQGPKGDLSKAQGYVDTVKRFYGKDFTQTPPQESSSQSLDMGDIVAKYGVDPYPKESPSNFTIPNIPQEQPDATDIAQGIDESAIGRGFSQALNGPQPELGKLPFGVENKGGTISQLSKDILYGLPEGVMNLGAGLVGLPAAAIGSVAKLATGGSLKEAGDTFNEIAHTAMGTPQTATAQYMMKPFEVVFGGILNSGAEVVKDLNPTATPEELDSKIKATQYVMNLAMVAPMFKGAIRGRGKVDAENPAKSLQSQEITPEVVESAKTQVLNDPQVAPEIKAQVESITPDFLQTIKQKASESIAKERVQNAGIPTTKFEGNQSIVEGLLTEVELREGRAKTTMRKAARIVAEMDGDVASADLKSIKGINPEGSTGKAIARLIEEREVSKQPISESKIPDPPKMENDVPISHSNETVTMYHGGLGPDGTPRWVTPDLEYAKGYASKSSGKVYSVEVPIDYPGMAKAFDDSGTRQKAPYVNFELGGELANNFKEVIEPVKSLEEIPAKVEDSIQSMAVEVDPSLKYDGKMNGIPEAGIPDIHNFTLKLDDGREPSFSVSGEVTPEKIDAEIQKVKDKFKPKEEEVILNGQERQEQGQGQQGLLKTEEPLPISEFDNINLAIDEGYSFPLKKRFSKLEDAQAKAQSLGEGHEVVKVGDKYRVGKFDETPSLKEYSDEASLNADGWELMSEVPSNKIKFESPSEGFGLAKVGDKYYRISKYVEMPEIEVKSDLIPKDKWEDDVSPEDWAALKSLTDESTYNEILAQDKLKELAEISKVDGVKTPESNAALAKSFLEWRDSYVTKCNIAQEIPVTKDYYTLYHGNSSKLKSSKDMPDGHRGYFATEDVNVAKKFGENIHEIRISKDSIFDPRDPAMIDQFIEAYKKYRVIDNEVRFKQIAQSGNFSLFERPASKHALEDLGYKGNWQVEDGASVIRVFKKEDFNIQSKDTKISKKKVTKESLSIVDDNFKTFDSEEAIKAWIDANGKVGEIISDPLTGKYSFLDSEKFGKLDEMDMWDEGVEQLSNWKDSRIEDWDNPEVGLSDTGKMDLFSILNNERGSVDITSLRSTVDLIQGTVKAAQKMGKSIDEYLMHIGADEIAIEAFKSALAQVPQMKQQLREQDPVTSSILLPEGKVVAQTINRNRNKQVVSVGPPITEALASKVMNADRTKQWGSDTIFKDPETGKVQVHHTSNMFERFMEATETKINAFRSAGLQDVYSMWREAKSAAEKEKVQVKEWLDNLESQIAPDRREAFALAAYADMKSVKEAFETMGIAEIPELTPAENKVLDQLLDYTRKFRDRSNYIRTHTGQKAIPQLKDMKGRENYLPLVRDINVLRDMGLTEGLTISDSKKLGELSKKFNGMFNPNSKKRNVSDIPIELDPFKALKRHAEYGLDEIHISPIAALAKDLANLKLPRVDGVKGKISLAEWNPSLSRMLSRWSDQIVGKDIVGTAMANANPFFSKVTQGLSRNLVVATIGGSLRTILVQPTSYAIGIPTMLDMRSAAYGLFKLASDRPFGKSNARTNSSVLAIREAEYAYKELADYIQQGKMSGVRAFIADKSLAPMKWVDSIIAEASWNAARYYGERKLKLQGKELYRFADDVVERTQGMGLKGAVSDVQSSAATKWLTLLQTFGISDFNLIARDVLGIKNPEANQSKTIIRVAKYTAATILTGQLYKMMGLENVVPDPIGAYEEAKKEGAGDLRALGVASAELLEKIPIVGGSAKYGSSLGGIAGEWAGIVPDAAAKLGQSLDWKKLTPKQRSYNIRLMARAAGYTLGIPYTNQILKSVNSAYKGGNPWEVILGVYEKEKKKSGSLRPEIPRPPHPAKTF